MDVSTKPIQEEIDDWVYFNGLKIGKRYNVYDEDGHLMQKDVLVQYKSPNSISFKICGIIIETGIPIIDVKQYANLIENESPNKNIITLKSDSFDLPQPLQIEEDDDNPDPDPFLNIPRGDHKPKFKFKLLKDDKLSTCSISGGSQQTKKNLKLKIIRKSKRKSRRKSRRKPKIIIRRKRK